MDLGDAYAAIRSRLEANFTAAPIRWPNEAFDPPEPPSAFVYAEVAGNAERIAGFGSPGANLWRNSGALLVHVYVPRGSGESVAHTHADALAAIFRGRSFSGVQCMAASVSPGEPANAQVGDRAVGAFYRVTVAVEFRFDIVG